MVIEVKPIIPSKSAIHINHLFYKEIVMSEKIREIPYGISDFETIRVDNCYFVDKTRFIHMLEKHKYIFFIRPRRFGKSIWLSILECYYDINLKERFDEYFNDMYIGENPTSEKNSYFVMRFDFSAVNPDPDKIEESFETYCADIIELFMDVYNYAFDEKLAKKIENRKQASQKLDAIFIYAKKRNLKIYMLIDEYDNFANTIISTAGKEAYHNLTHGEGFFKHFFATLKSATAMRGSGLARLFITGVSPVTMDDVTSGFNIGTNISILPFFNEMTGFTEDEVFSMLDYYKKAGRFTPDISESMKLVRKWYGGYIFSSKASVSLFNTDMILYFINTSYLSYGLPEYLIDDNAKTDYTKLKHLMFINRQINGNLDILKTIMENREIISPVNQSFPIERLLEADNFISLLYFFGLLTFRGITSGRPLLAIPNMTISHLMYGYIRGAYEDADIFRVNLWKFGNFVAGMGWRGKWEEVFFFIAEEIKKQTKIRDYLSGEKVIQGFLLAYMSINDFFIPHTEYEANKGYSDFFLEPFLIKYPDMPYGYLIEIKYLKRSEELTDTIIEKAEKDAKKQLMQYSKDGQFSTKYKNQTIIKLLLLYHGWEMICAKKIY